MNRLIVLGLAATFGAANYSIRAMQGSSVELQPATPGVAQTGHLNISGTAVSRVVRAETVFGNSPATTGIASGGDFRSASTSGRGFYALASATSGLTYGGFFQNQSSTGRAVYGLATGTSAANYGGYFQAAGTSARGVLGVATATSGINYGGYFQGSSPAGYGVFAASSTGTALGTAGKSQFNGAVELASGSFLSIGAGPSPLFPIDFDESLGAKISLWGNSADSNFGIGIQPGRFQIYTGGDTSAISFGFGGSAAFTERFRMIHNTTEFRFNPAGTGNEASTISSPFDLFIEHDLDNNNTLSWIRVFTNNFTIEQMRIYDEDEAPALFDGSVVANGIDFAEGFKAHDPTLEPGDLVVNSSSNWESIVKSRTPYQTGVIGVISTKPAFVAGMSFDAEDCMDPELTKQRDEARRSGNKAVEKQLTQQMREMVQQAYRPVAFMGRVPVKVTGVVKAGDNLTASILPGVAMSMGRPGHSVGIALEASSGGSRTIMAHIQPGYFAGPVGTLPIGLASDLNSMKIEIERLRTENNEVRERLHRLERLLLANKR